MEPSPAPLEIGSRFADRYEIRGELGSGAWGRVYEARQLSTEQAVAIKLLHARDAGGSGDRAAERFRREAQICAALSHTNVVPLIDSGETRDGRLYAVFPLVPGQTLAETLEQEGRLEGPEALRLMTQVLEALAAAHAKGVVHRDLEPANVMLSAAGVRRNALVLDFGLGGWAEGRQRQTWQIPIRTQASRGTRSYAAPEQLAGEPATERSDLYAWGLVFLECLSGRHPFAQGAAQQRPGDGGAVEIPAWLGKHPLGELLASVTAHEPDQREGSAEALLEALDGIREPLPVAPVAARTPAPLADSGERRHLTVLFCDLVGSSALSQRLGAEAYRSVVRAYHEQAVRAVERFGGHVAQYLGDGLLVYFGHPEAHEDDAERAVRAARGILSALAALAPRLEAEHGATLRARVGIHTGPVVVDEVGGGQRKETLALGDTPNVAARLQALAEPGTVVISDATLRRVAGLFITEDRGSPELKGIAEPIRVHRVLEPSGVVSRLDRAPRLTPFVGREQELGLLHERFEQVREGRGQAVWIAGEAGIGKSRLVHRLHESLREERTPYSWLECSCSQYATGSALHPVIEVVEQGLRFEDADTPDEKLARLERGLELAGLAAEPAVPLVASLLSLEIPERHAPLEMGPQLQRQRTLEALLAWVLALAEKQPLVLVVEDLHWADPSTLAWLGLLIQQCATSRVLLLLTHRPEFEPPWPARGHVLPVALGRLGHRHAEELAAAAAGEALPAELVDRLAERADGIPLFVEELAKGAAESGRDPGAALSELEIPETLQDSLMARLDRLGDAKSVAQVGAVIGREFPYVLLEAVAPADERPLREGLGRLVEAEIVFQRGLPPRAVYTFKHALVQDTAYQSLLASQRRELHGRVADALEADREGRFEAPPELVGHHCAEAGYTERAVEHLTRAGVRAAERYQNEEAIAQLERATALLRTLPEDRERDERELRIQMTLGPAIMAARGHAQRVCERVWKRAHELSERLGNTLDRGRTLAGLAAFHLTRGELDAVTEIAGRLIEHGERTGDDASTLLGHFNCSMVDMQRGRAESSVAHCDRLLEIDSVAGRRRLLTLQDPAATTLSMAAWALWSMGCPDRALEYGRRAMERARTLEHPYTLAFTLLFVAKVVGQMRGDRAAALALNDECLEIAERYDFQLIIGGARIDRGCLLLESEGSERLQLIRDGISVSGATGNRTAVPLYLSNIATTHRELGLRSEARELLDVALAISRKTGACFWDAEIHRSKGDLALDEEDPDEAGSLFHLALETARSQDAKSHELRAATSLARLWREQDRGEDARALLAPVYGWFTEGLDTPDLKGARALLDALA